MNILWGHFVHLIIILRLIKDKEGWFISDICSICFCLREVFFFSLYKTEFHYPKDTHFTQNSHLCEMANSVLAPSNELSVEHSPFMLSDFFLSIIEKECHDWPKCHRLWQTIHAIEKSLNALNFYEALSSLLRRVRVFENNEFGQYPTSISFPFLIKRYLLIFAFVWT